MLTDTDIYNLKEGDKLILTASFVKQDGTEFVLKFDSDTNNNWLSNLRPEEMRCATKAHTRYYKKGDQIKLCSYLGRYFPDSNWMELDKDTGLITLSEDETNMGVPVTSPAMTTWHIPVCFVQLVTPIELRSDTYLVHSTKSTYDVVYRDKNCEETTLAKFPKESYSSDTEAYNAAKNFLTIIKK